MQIVTGKAGPIIALCFKADSKTPRERVLTAELAQLTDRVNVPRESLAQQLEGERLVHCRRHDHGVLIVIAIPSLHVLTIDADRAVVAQS
jgi:hypothetical protein